MKKNVLVQEAISLLEELEGVNAEPQPEDQKSLKKKNSNSLKTKDVASAIAAASGGNLIAIRLEEKPKLQITNAGFAKLENQKLDTFSKKLRHLAPNAFIAEQNPSDQGSSDQGSSDQGSSDQGSSEKFELVGGDDIAPGDKNNRSGRDYAVQVVDPKSRITHVIPIVSIYSPLSQYKIIGFGAEWAVWLGLNDKSPTAVDLFNAMRNAVINARAGSDPPDVFTVEEFGEIKIDKRLINNLVSAGLKAVAGFVNDVESMKNALKDNPGDLAGYSTEGMPPPDSGSGRVDITAKRGPEEISISVKYGGTERLGSATEVAVEGSSANIFRSVSKNAGGEEGSGSTWRTNKKQPEGGKTLVKPELEVVRGALEAVPREAWFSALASEAREWLGLPPNTTAAAKNYAIVQFPSTKSVKVTKPSGGDWKIQVARGSESSFKGAYVISVEKKDEEGNDQVVNDVLRVELRFTDRKYTQWHKGPGWAELFKDAPLAEVPSPPPSGGAPANESSKRKPRRTEASATAAVQGVTVPLGRDPDGRAALGGEELLDRNAKVYGKSWGGAKPIKEAIELLGILREEKGQ